jgi:hypothetical protein
LGELTTKNTEFTALAAEVLQELTARLGVPRNEVLQELATKLGRD